MSETVTLRYLTPVYVGVDVERERVVSVQVSDAGATLDAAYVKGIRRRETAARIAEACDWPEWEVGE